LPEGVTLLDQERAAKPESRPPCGSKDAAKANVARAFQTPPGAVVAFRTVVKSAPEKDPPNIHLFWARMGDALPLAWVEMTRRSSDAYQQAIAGKKT